MHVEQSPITGREPKERLTPQLRALAEFYQALNDRDMRLMARTWAQTDEAVMDNPVGAGRRRDLSTRMIAAAKVRIRISTTGSNTTSRRSSHGSCRTR